MSELRTDIEIGDATNYELRTFVVKDGRLASIVQTGSFWDEEGVCEAICIAHPADDDDHVVPADDCTCGVYCYWTVEDLVHEDGRYTKEASEIVAVVLLYGRTIDGDNGTRAKAARIVAYWCAEDKPKLARACAASAPEPVREPAPAR